MTTERSTQQRGPREGSLVDHPQRGVGTNRFQSVRIDVGTSINTRSPVFLEQAEPDQSVDGRAADPRVGSSLVDRQQFRQVDQILAAPATSSLHHCDIGTTKLSHHHNKRAPFLIRH